MRKLSRRGTPSPTGGQEPVPYVRLVEQRAAVADTEAVRAVQVERPPQARAAPKLSEAQREPSSPRAALQPVEVLHQEAPTDSDGGSVVQGIVALSIACGVGLGSWLAAPCAWLAAYRKHQSSAVEVERLQPLSKPKPLLQRKGSVRRVETSKIPIMIDEGDWEKFAPLTGLLFPHAPLKFRWDLFMLALILYSSVTVPFRMGMDHPAEEGWWVLEASISLFFIADLLFNFNTAYASGDTLILDRDMIRQHYIGGWFTVDLLSSIPLELIDFAMTYFRVRHSRGGLPARAAAGAAATLPRALLRALPRRPSPGNEPARWLLM